MEKYVALETSASFASSRDNGRSDNAAHRRHHSDPVHTKSDGQTKGETDQERSLNVDESASVPELTLQQVMEQVDRFIDTLNSTKEDHQLNPSEVSQFIECLYKMVESFIVKYESRESSARFGQNQDEDAAFFQSLNGISRLLNNFGELSSKDAVVSSLNGASNVLHRAMSLLDEEFRSLLDNRRNYFELKTPKTPKQSAFSSNFASNHESDPRCVAPETESNEDDEFPSFTPEAISNMNKISKAMISAGYEKECCMVYSIFRRIAFKDQLNKLGFENISADEVQRMQWESLEGEIASWISIFKHCYTVLFSVERKLSDSVFSDYPLISQRLFSDLATAVIIQFLNFGEAVGLTKRSAEKMFKFLDIYETLKDLIPAIGDLYSYKSAKDLAAEISEVKSRVGEAAVSIFCELESSIKSDQGRTPVPSGQVHPLTRYTMNYLKYTCEYKDTLEEVFKHHHKVEVFNESTGMELESQKSETENYPDDGTPRNSPFSRQLMTIMELLDANLDMKSKLYRDPSLRYIFLMNNGRYIVQKIKGSMEIHDMMGITWCKKRSTDLRQYHKNYQRETWSKVLQCMNHEGLQVNGKVMKSVLKERFKNVNTLFEEIHKTQSTWVVSDEQLQSELRVSISAVVIPAYRSFLGRFKHLYGRQGEKYIKYQPEDIETLIEELFDGNPVSMGRRRN